MRAEANESPLRKARAAVIFQELVAYGRKGVPLVALYCDLAETKYPEWSREHIDRAVDDLVRGGRVRLAIRPRGIFVKAIENDAAQ